MVRGLVHEQDVGLLDQLAGDRQALAPAAGEDVDGLSRVVEAHLAEDDGDAGGLLELLGGIVRQGRARTSSTVASRGNAGSCGT